MAKYNLFKTIHATHYQPMPIGIVELPSTITTNDIVVIANTVSSAEFYSVDKKINDTHDVEKLILIPLEGKSSITFPCVEDQMSDEEMVVAFKKIESGAKTDELLMNPVIFSFELYQNWRFSPDKTIKSDSNKSYVPSRETIYVVSPTLRRCITVVNYMRECTYSHGTSSSTSLDAFSLSTTSQEDVFSPVDEGEQTYVDFGLTDDTPVPPLHHSASQASSKAYCAAPGFSRDLPALPVPTSTSSEPASSNSGRTFSAHKHVAATLVVGLGYTYQFFCLKSGGMNRFRVRVAHIFGKRRLSSVN